MRTVFVDDPLAAKGLAKIVELRALLVQKFPTAHAQPLGPVVRGCGLPTLDALGAGLGALTECVAPAGSGAALLLRRMVAETVAAQRMVALVDGSDCFDPCRSTDYRKRLVWVRCQSLQHALKAADLLLRDGNLPLVLVDLQMLPERELLRTPSSSWLRLRALAERAGALLLLLTPTTAVPCAQHRIQLCWELDMMALEGSPERYLQQLPFVCLSQRSRLTEETGQRLQEERRWA
jgi:hypothetical protein